MTDAPRYTRGPLAALIRFCLEHKLVVVLATFGFVAWGMLVTRSRTSARTSRSSSPSGRAAAPRTSTTRSATP
jgi:hypothetical protein